MKTSLSMVHLYSGETVELVAQVPCIAPQPSNRFQSGIGRYLNGKPGSVPFVVMSVRIQRTVGLSRCNVAFQALLIPTKFQSLRSLRQCHIDHHDLLPGQFSSTVTLSTETPE